ncbi:hypothetical protein L596_016274 [Steinernema carpocapsae]|uniref:Mediator complex subunit Med12 LCEWAV-domain domain-containing protein n=1 Tax=Steinernema carpocapsae TaxID=34508 RepID=A0A4U5NIH2_STECR|nr:hypothetical protein L596_016274 [Steinernema carpocapsae]
MVRKKGARPDSSGAESFQADSAPELSGLAAFFGPSYSCGFSCHREADVDCSCRAAASKMYKNLGVTSWHDNKPEKRVLAKKRQVPDIYPQELKQEEDSLSPSRLKQGYALPVPNYEQETLFREFQAPKYDKFIDDGLLKCGKIITSVMTGKNEANNKMMSRQRSVNKEAPGQPPPYITKQDKREGKQQWFVDLNTLKSFSQLARRPPPLTSDLSKRNQECFDLLFEFRVPPPKAIWFLKFIAVHPQTVSTTSKGSKMKQTEFPGRDLILAEQSKNFIRVIADIVVKLNDFSSAESSKVIAFWNYLVPVFKHSFEDGLVDRQDFLMELAEVLHSQSNYPMDKPFAFRSLLVFYSHFICTVTQNVILARRVAHVVANRIRLYKAELDKCRKVKNAPETEAWYQDLLACQHHRPIIYTLTGILHAIVIECPQALIWNSFQVSSNQALPHQLCGSPLDVLPCPPEDLPLPPGPTKDSVVRVLKSKLTEIKRRSWGVKRNGR